MICAIYARKSTDQNGTADEARSVARQVEHAKAYAARKGWTVAEGHVYIDDGISGAVFGAGRPGLARLLNALRPRPAFDVLVMSEESRLGRESIETAGTLKQITDAGVRCFFYLEDRERTLETATDKVMLSLVAFGADMEREKARQRTADAMRRKARAGHVTGGTVYGYRNIEIRTPEGRRAHVAREVHPDQAAVVRRIFEDYAGGAGIVRIAKRLNAEGTAPPRARGWAPSAVREMLRRDLYRGIITWNRSAKDVRGGVKRQRRRDEREWIRREAPELAIVSAELAAAVDARLRSAASTFPRGARGALTGGAVQAPGYASPYILTNFARCAECGGPIGTITRSHGTGAKRWRARFYGCTTRDRRGPAVCSNHTLLRHEVLDAAFLDAVRARLDDSLVRDAIARSVALRRERQGAARERRPEVERELHAVEQRIGRLVDAIATGGPVEELLERLRAERARKAALVEEQRAVNAGAVNVDRAGDDLVARLTARAAELRRLLGVHVQRTRQLLGAMLAGPVKMVPVVEDGRRGYRFSGRLRLGGLLAGAGLEIRHAVVAPTGLNRCSSHPAGRRAGSLEWAPPASVDLR
jgi:site-specific DNA recombinase